MLSHPLDESCEVRGVSVISKVEVGRLLDLVIDVGSLAFGRNGAWDFDSCVFFMPHHTWLVIGEDFFSWSERANNEEVKVVPRLSVPSYDQKRWNMD